MSNNYFEIIRAGINTTFQDKGRNNLYHIGIPFSGAMDNRNYLLANKLVGNKLDLPVIEFAYQGPLLKYNGDKINIAVNGDVIFELRKKDITLALELAKKALTKDPNYVDYDFRKEQLWGEKLQNSTEILLQNDQLQTDVTLANPK